MALTFGLKEFPQCLDLSWQWASCLAQSLHLKILNCFWGQRFPRFVSKLITYIVFAQVMAVIVCVLLLSPVEGGEEGGPRCGHRARARSQNKRKLFILKARVWQSWKYKNTNWRKTKNRQRRKRQDLTRTGIRPTDRTMGRNGEDLTNAENKPGDLILWGELIVSNSSWG